MDHYNQKPKVKEQNNQDMGGKSNGMESTTSQTVCGIERSLIIIESPI
jgi:hypothetical protein